MRLCLDVFLVVDVPAGPVGMLLVEVVVEVSELVDPYAVPLFVDVKRGVG